MFPELFATTTGKSVYLDQINQTTTSIVALPSWSKDEGGVRLRVVEQLLDDRDCEGASFAGTSFRKTDDVTA